jgi:hypothetical protein
MTRITIKWFVVVDSPNDLDGVVLIVHAAHNEILGEFKIEVNPTNITYQSLGPQKGHLPLICDDKDIMERVATMAKIYHAGFSHHEVIYTWL